jgi:hypothetical protein
MRLATGAALLILMPAPAQGFPDFVPDPSLDFPVCDGGSTLGICGWELRPDVDEWMGLIAPIDQEIIGTRGADALAAGDQGDVVRGLGGADSLTSAFNRTALLGDRGGDALMTDATAVGDGILGLAIQLGGAGDDSHRARLGVLGYEANGELLLDLGSGHDRVDAEVYMASGDFNDDDGGIVANQIFARSGNDEIVAVADAQRVSDDALALNAVAGGAGADRISALAITEFYGSTTIADNRLNGGGGDDVIDASAVSVSNYAKSASNSLFGGDGNDVITARCVTDSNVDNPTGYNGLWGGAGDDELEAVHITDGENYITDLRTVLDGGAGNDSLHADSTAWGENVLTLHELAGGAGDDLLTLLLDLRLSGTFFDGLNDSSNVLDGGPGSDHLEAAVTADCAFACEEPTPRAQNHLAGGDGNDVLVASVAPEVDGASFLSGGNGNDELTVAGGAGNELDGGNGSDSLSVGDGDERLTGGDGRDTFYFDLSEDQGSDTLADFETNVDVMSFAGISDVGAPGLADDLDAISTFTDLGPASDVEVDLTIGTQIVFVGRGTGEVDSWAELLPAQALAQWAGSAKIASDPPARSLRVKAEDLALLPRDH